MILNYIVSFFVSAAVSGILTLMFASAAANGIEDEKKSYQVCWLIILIGFLAIVAGTVFMGKYLP